jgi:predicted dienelactone hydrolase
MLLLAMSAVLSSPLRGAEYDPLLVASTKPDQRDFEVHDANRSRKFPIRVYLPNEEKAPVVLFSHGLGGTRSGCEYLGNHWAARGYAAVFLQHPGSDDSVWKDKPLGERMAARREAAGAENFLLRVKDVPALLDQLAVWNEADDHPLRGRLDLSRIGMSGHSFGAVTTQAVSGQTNALGTSYTDRRIKAAVMMSPSPPRRGDPKRAFGDVKIPWLLLTGTKDGSPLGNIEVQDRFVVFPALAPGDKYELVLHNAEHSAFSDRRLAGDVEQRNPNHHRAILAVTTAFWDAHLRDDPQAKSWLVGEAMKRVLEANDRWQRK